MSPEASAARPGRVRFAPFLLFATAILATVVVGGGYVLFKPFEIPSASNIPTLLVGDVIVASRLSYGLSRYSLPIDLGFKGRVLGREPRRGDVVVFRLPRDTSIVYVKRVIGLPGDTVQMKAGRLILNGTMVKRDAIAKVTAETYTGVSAEVPTYRETLPGGASYTIIEIQGDFGFNDNTDVVTVPAGQIFVLGDNRDNSLDSRVAPDQGGVGFVPFDNLVAQVDFVLYNSSHPDRTLKPIR